ncbi:MAG: magnesium/cobalt transporter CorA [Deltaproteobacteria bacterium]|nr:magnesium/cobalt transporter CorA [Deltaproteobacteria bacterium]
MRKKHSVKSTIALPPGTLVHVGPPHPEPASLTALRFDATGVEEGGWELVEAHQSRAQAAPRPGVLWVQVSGVHDLELLTRVGEAFGLHALAVEDLANTLQRPKVDDYGDHILMVLRRLSFDPQNMRLKDQQIGLVFGQGWVLSFVEEEDPWAPVRQRLTAGRGRARGLGADYLAYALADSVVDSYFALLEDLEEELDRLEEQVQSGPGPEGQDLPLAIYRFKREGLKVRRAIWPLREAVGQLLHGRSPLLSETTLPYLRDLYDHLVHVIDAAESIRDQLAVMMDLALTDISNRMNQVIKVLTIISTIFIPLTFLAGLYGMNFKYMPELDWRWGYPAVLLVMALVVGAMLWFFRRRKWL